MSPSGVRNTARPDRKPEPAQNCGEKDPFSRKLDGKGRGEKGGCFEDLSKVENDGPMRSGIYRAGRCCARAGGWT